VALAIVQAGDSFDLGFTDVVIPGGMTGDQLAAAAQRLQPGLRGLITTGYVSSIAGGEPVGRIPRDDPKAVPRAGPRSHSARHVGRVGRICQPAGGG
jgi:hypothetical protein